MIRNRVCCVLIAVCVSAMASNVVSAKDESTRFLYRSQLTGLSMFPTIKSGEFIYYEKTSVSDLKEGDIVVYQDRVSGDRVCHRVLSVERGVAYVKGDNNRFRDKETVQDENLLGRVTHINEHPV